MPTVVLRNSDGELVSLVIPDGMNQVPLINVKYHGDGSVEFLDEALILAPFPKEGVQINEQVRLILEEDQFPAYAGPGTL